MLYLGSAPALRWGSFSGRLVRRYPLLERWGMMEGAEMDLKEVMWFGW